MPLYCTVHDHGHMTWSYHMICTYIQHHQDMAWSGYNTYMGSLT